MGVSPGTGSGQTEAALLHKNNLALRCRNYTKIRLTD